MTATDAGADQALFEAIQSYILDANSGDFDDLALRLFARHFALNEPYRTYCVNAGATPVNVENWTDIPATPARAFKLMLLSCSSTGEAAAVFHSSGTTEGQPSRNFLDVPGLKLYETSLRAGFQRVAPEGLRLLALMQSPVDAPHSSLSYMLGALGASEFFWGEQDHARLFSRLETVADHGEPVCVFGTAFALLDLFDAAPQTRWSLPAGSILVETGGFKGRTRQVSRAELYALIEQRLDVRPPRAFAEYGMSEMASQYYSDAANTFAGGHWVRARVIDPLTDADAEVGVLRHFDLANWNSVSSIQTQDMGEMEPSGRFRLLGRAADAELRGCSLTMEEHWQRLALK